MTKIEEKICELCRNLVEHHYVHFNYNNDTSSFESKRCHCDLFIGINNT